MRANRWVCLAVLILLTLTTAATTQAAIPASERQALMDLYTSTNGAGWTNSTNWNGPVGTECTWFGVTCNTGQTTVQWLILYQDNLAGSLPASLANLSNLQYLYLQVNQLSGLIPAQLGNLANLRYLDLHSNKLSGAIPAQLGSLASLQYLYLNANQLVGAVPNSITNLTNLVAGFSDFRWDGLYSADPAVVAFLNAAQGGGDWQSTQTVPVTGLATGAVTNSSVVLTWTPIAYISDPGGYQVFDSTTAGGPYNYADTIPSKSTSTWTVTQLEPGTTYYFIMRSYTSRGVNNQNTVMSDPSAEVHATTTGTVPSPLTITTASPLPPGTVGIPYSQQLSASGGTRPYYWYPGTGSMPNGLSVWVDGLLYSIAGTPTVAGDFSFTLVVYDSASTRVEGAFTLHVNASACTSPSITSQPQGESIQNGQTATLSVIVTGTPSLSFQWYQGAAGDTSHPVGTNASSFLTPALTATTSYWVQVSNSCGQVDSATATIRVGVVLHRIRRHLQRAHS